MSTQQDSLNFVLGACGITKLEIKYYNAIVTDEEREDLNGFTYWVGQQTHKDIPLMKATVLHDVYGTIRHHENMKFKLFDDCFLPRSSGYKKQLPN